VARLQPARADNRELRGCRRGVPHAGEGGGASSPGSAPFLPPPPEKQGKHFTHIVVLIQENRTLDNLFATFPGADGTTVGKTHNGTRRLAEANL